MRFGCVSDAQFMNVNPFVLSISIYRFGGDICVCVCVNVLVGFELLILIVWGFVSYIFFYEKFFEINSVFFFIEDLRL